nr:sugar phosphate nucleotidyltransferase [uncultured Pseudomonas sp.]
MTRAYVLCGGFGTRLRSVIQNTQKAVVPVNGQPFLQHVLRQLGKAGVCEAVLCAHYRADQLAELLGELAAASSLRLELVVEATPLGTGGALLNALREHPSRERYLVLNADTFVASAAYQLALDSPGNVLVATRVTDAGRFGSVEFDANGHLRTFQEKGFSGSGLINAGVYGFLPDAFTQPPVTCSLERELLPQLMGAGEIAVHEYHGDFIDIGTPEALQLYRTSCAERARS